MRPRTAIGDRADTTVSGPAVSTPNTPPSASVFFVLHVIAFGAVVPDAVPAGLTAAALPAGTVPSRAGVRTEVAA